MPAFVSIQNRAKNGCPRSSASKIGRKMDAHVCQHPKIGLRKDARIRQHPKSDEKRMPAFVSIRNRTKNGCSRMPASEIERKTDAHVCQHPKLDKKWMLTYASIQNRAKNGCPRTPASKNRPTKGCPRMLASFCSLIHQAL